MKSRGAAVPFDMRTKAARSMPLDDRFWSFVPLRTPGQCWVWAGGLDYKGYGTFCYQSRLRRAHRVAWMLATGKPPPGGLCVCHRCDNPSCVNPGHLFLGTHGDNARDRNLKGRQQRLRGAQKPNAKLTDKAVRLIRSSPQTSLTALAAKLGVSVSAVSSVRRGASWRHVELERRAHQ